MINLDDSALPYDGNMSLKDYGDAAKAWAKDNVTGSYVNSTRAPMTLTLSMWRRVDSGILYTMPRYP